MTIRSRSAVLALIIGSCVGCDQATKAVAEASLGGGRAVELPGGILSLVCAENQGTFLGLGSERGGRR